MRLRHLLIVLTGWAAFLMFGCMAIWPLIEPCIISGGVPLQDVPFIIAATGTMGLLFAAVLYIPVTALIGLTVQVFDDDGEHRRV